MSKICLPVGAKSVFKQLFIWRFKLVLIALGAPRALRFVVSVVFLGTVALVSSWNLSGGFIAHLLENDNPPWFLS
jgi:hypothetical protein